MAPSTATPSDLHRAPVACLSCRKAKVRCLISQRHDRCDRCIANNIECVFAQQKRARVRPQPYPQRPKRSPKTTAGYGQHSARESASTATLAVPSQLVSTDSPIDAYQPSTSQKATPIDGRQQLQSQHQQPVITNVTRARIIAALATLKGTKGSPFSFVTSGDSPSFSARFDASRPSSRDAQGQQPLDQSQSTPLSLKLSWLLRPLNISAHRDASDDDRRPSGLVKMPTYLSSMTLGQTITDPIEGGMVSSQASKALFEHFMLQMNAKWEYILDPHVDTHDSVQRRSSLLFASILFCSSKFANYIDGRIVSEIDPFLQSRLCSLARNLVIKNLAEGNRSIETMQALYLLVCWKDADDDVSYLHSGYAFSILRDLDLESNDCDGQQVVRRRRTWLALFRQDRQQSLFFVRRAPLSQGDEVVSFLVDPDTWLKMPYTLPCDFVACCSADLRLIQSKLRTLVQKASLIMLPCLLELMDGELSAWRLKWKNHLQGEDRTYSNDPSLNPRLVHPGEYHITALVDLWEHSVRLNIASALLRQALMASMTSSLHGQPANASLDLDLTTIQQVLSPSLPGLEISIKGAFGILQSLMKFPSDDLRRAPDALLLLAPNAALFLCLLLCLPSNSILGSAFQRTAVALIRDIGHHIGQCVKSPQDTVALHAAYIDSLVELLEPPTSHCSTEQQDMSLQTTFDALHTHVDTNGLNVDDPTLQAPQVLADGVGGHDYNMAQTDALFTPSDDRGQNLHLQSLANLLDGNLFWETLPVTENTNIGL